MLYLLQPFYAIFVLFIDIIEFIWLSIWDVFNAIHSWLLPQLGEKLEGKTVLITGAANGVGKCLAHEFAGVGCNVICWDIEKDANLVTAESVRSQFPKVHAFAYQVDVSNHSQVQETAELVLAKHKKIDILVNNAGLMPVKRFLSHTPREIERLFGVNVFSHIWTLQAFMPSFQQAGSGTVVSVSSNCGLMGSANLAPYCATKHAVRGLTEALTEEDRRFSRSDHAHIHHLTVFPYIIQTRLVKYPRVRFPWLMPILRPEQVARDIVDAVRRKEEVLFFPQWMYPLFLFSRLWPRRMQQRFYDLIDAGLDEYSLEADVVEPPHHRPDM